MWAAIAGDFQPEHVNGFPMRPDAGSIDLVRFLLACSLDSGFVERGAAWWPQAPECRKAFEGPGALTRGGSRPAGRGSGRRAVVPVG